MAMSSRIITHGNSNFVGRDGNRYATFDDMRRANGSYHARMFSKLLRK